jgi:hypothetical protein
MSDPGRSQDRASEAAWERAWSARYEKAPPERPRPRGRRRHSSLVHLLIATAGLGTLISSIAIADSGEDLRQAGGAARVGDPITLGERNPRSGGASEETSLVANAGSSGLVLRPSNTAKGGRAVSATCDNDGTAAEDGCAVYVNKGTGAAASFRTQGSVPFALRETNTGLVRFLNADMVDGRHASEFLTASSKAADSETLDGQDSSAFLGASAKATDSDTLDGKDSKGFARIGGLVKADGTPVGTGFTSAFVGTDIYYLVSFPDGTFKTASGCNLPVPVVSATSTNVRSLLVHEPTIVCDPATGAGSFRVYLYTQAGGSTTGGFSFIVL